jgi:hypothetical protein
MREIPQWWSQLAVPAWDAAPKRAPKAFRRGATIAKNAAFD